MVSRLANTGSSDKRIGPAIVLKVMSGDKFTAQVRGWYLPNGTAAWKLPNLALNGTRHDELKF